MAHEGAGDRSGPQYRCVASTAPGDAMRLFTNAVREGYRRLLAVGGDGTFIGLVNGLRASAEPPQECLVAAAAGGTGNDWSRAMQLPDDPGLLAACMARAHSRSADIGIAAGADGKQTAFHNVAGAGLDAAVLARTPRISGMRRESGRALLRPDRAGSTEWH